MHHLKKNDPNRTLRAPEYLNVSSYINKGVFHFKGVIYQALGLEFYSYAKLINSDLEISYAPSFKRRAGRACGGGGGLSKRPEYLLTVSKM